MPKTDLILNRDMATKYPDAGYYNSATNDANLDRLAYWSGSWQAATNYTHNEIVRHQGVLWICIVVGPVQTEPGTSAGLTDWQVMATIPGRAFMDTTPDTVGADIVLAWRALTEFDLEPLTAVGVTVDLLNGQWSFDHIGLWQLSFSFSLDHDELNAGRDFAIRLTNVTDGSSTPPVNIGVARNVAVTTYSTNILVQIGEADVGDSYRIDIGNAPTTIANVVWSSLGLSMLQVGAL